MPADLIFVNGRFTTLDRAVPNPEAVTLQSHRAIPGLNYNLELRWEGKKGRIQAGQLADLAVLSADYLRVAEPARDVRGFWGALGCSCFAF